MPADALDLSVLAALAQKAIEDGEPGEWYDGETGVSATESDAYFIAAVSPEVVLRMVEEIRGTALDRDRLRAALIALSRTSFALLTACMRADINEDLPGEVDGGYMDDIRNSLRSCPDCDGMGTRDKQSHEDEAIPDDNLCPRCEGWGFLPEHEALALTDTPTKEVAP